MTEQSANSQDSARTDWQPPSLPTHAVSIGPTGIRSTRRNVCPECGEQVHSQMESCPACGESLAQRPKLLRCMHCHTTASSQLTLCPNCGRELREAPPKLVTYGLPALLALLLVIVLVSQWERISPIAWVRTNLMRGVVIVENVGASIEPEVVIVMTPIVPEDAENSVVVSDTQAVAMATNSFVTPLPDPNDAQGPKQSIMAASVAQELPMGIGGPQPDGASEPPTAEPEALPSEPAAADTAPPESTPVATDTPPQPTATPEPTEDAGEQSTSRGGGMALALAASAPGTTPTPTWTAVVEVEGDVEVAEVAAMAASGTALPTPTATPTVGVTPQPTPTATPVVYQVDSGDTLVSIAAAYEVSVEELMAANDISEQEIYALQPGQMLIIPLPTPEVVAAAGGDPAALRLDVPELLVPTDGATVGCATGGKLIWERVQFVKDSDRYVLHLGFVNGTGSDGQESITWVLAQNIPVTQTEWQLDTSLCDLAPDDSASPELNHQWRWWVEVVEEGDSGTVSVSPPSEVWGFTWE